MKKDTSLKQYLALGSERAWFALTSATFIQGRGAGKEPEPLWGRAGRTFYVAHLNRRKRPTPSE